MFQKRQLLALLLALAAFQCGAGMAVAAELPFADKRHVTNFDKDYARVVKYFENIDLAKRGDFEEYLVRLEKWLKPISDGNRQHPDVVGCYDKIAALRAKIEAALAAEANKPKAPAPAPETPKPAPAAPGPEAGGGQGAKSGGGPSELPEIRPLPEKIADSFTRIEKYSFGTDFETPYRQRSKELLEAKPEDLASDSAANRFRNAAKKMRLGLEKLKDQGSPAVKECQECLASFERYVEAKAALGKRLVAEAEAKAAAAAKEADRRLGEIEAFFDPKKFDCSLARPFSVPRIREWVKRIREYQALRQKGLNLIEKVVKDNPASENDRRVKNLRYLFEKHLLERVQYAIDETTDFYPTGEGRREGRMPYAIRLARNLLAPGALTDDRLADTKWVAEALSQAEYGAEAAEGLAEFRKQYNGKDDPELRETARQCLALIDKLQAGAAKVLGDTRMPEADSADPELPQIAAETLKNPDYGVGPYERMVVNSKKYHHEERKSEAEADGEYLKITTWTEEWDQFQVCLAEQVEGEYRLVYYTLKRLERGPSFKIVGRWYVSDRIVSRKILKENIAK